MKEFQEGAVNTNGVTLHYWRSNLPEKPSTGPFSRSKPRLTLVLLHGVTDNGRCWKRVAEALRPSYDLLIPDSRGHGLSEAPETGYGTEDRAGDLAGIIKALEVERPVLIGHSMGAETAIGTAAIYPDLVRAVVLEDPPWPGRFYGSNMEERAERAAQWGSEIALQKNHSLSELTAQVLEVHPDWHPDDVEPWAEAKRQVNPNIANIVFAPRRRWNDYVREAACPILLITGDPAFGAIVSEQTVREAAVYWKNGRVVNIPDAGHSMHRDQFDLYMKAVRGFLDKLSR